MSLHVVPCSHGMKRSDRVAPVVLVISFITPLRNNVQLDKECILTFYHSSHSLRKLMVNRYPLIEGSQKGGGSRESQGVQIVNNLIELRTSECEVEVRGYFKCKSGFWLLGFKIDQIGWERPLIHRGDVSYSFTIVLSNSIQYRHVRISIKFLLSLQYIANCIEIFNAHQLSSICSDFGSEFG